MLERLWASWVVEPWLDADRTSRDPTAAPADVRDVALVVLGTLSLVAIRSFGTRSDLDRLFPGVRDTLPFPGLAANLYWVLFTVTAYAVVPALFVRLALREPLADHGVQLGTTREHVRGYATFLAVVLPFVAAASFSPSFLSKYPFPKAAGDDPISFLIWELGYGAQFVALEFFFRGFLILRLSRRIGAYAVLVPLVPYVMVHFGKPLPETIGAIITGLVLGTLALRSRSIVGGILVHLTVAWSMDVLALWQKGAFAAWVR